MQEIQSVAVSAILDGIYSKKLLLNKENVVATLKTAHLFQMNNIVQHCGNFMTRPIRHGTCPQYMHLADTYNLDNLVEKAHRMMNDSFVKVTKAAEFLDISQDGLYKLLDSDKIRGEEIDIFEALLRWICHKEEERGSFFPQLFSRLRLAYIKMPDLVSRVSRCKFVQGNEDCTKLIDEAVQYHSDLYDQPFHTGTVCQRRGHDSILMLFQRADSEMVIIHESIESDASSTAALDKVLYKEWSRCSVICGGFLFMYGVDVRSNTSCLLRVDLHSMEVLNLCPLPQIATYGVTLCVIGKDIVCVGGHFESKKKTHAGEFTSKVWKYNIPKNSWSHAEDVPVPVAYAVSCRNSSTGNPWVLGGLAQSANNHAYLRPSNAVYEYDTTGKVWLTKPKMLELRSITHKVCEMSNEVMIAIGGINVEPQNFCEIFAFDTQQWTYVKLPAEIDVSYEIQLKGIGLPSTCSSTFLPSYLLNKCLGNDCSGSEGQGICMLIDGKEFIYKSETNMWEEAGELPALVNVFLTHKHFSANFARGAEFVGPIKIMPWNERC